MPDIRSSLIARADDPPAFQVAQQDQGGKTRPIVVSVTIPNTGGPAVGERIRWGRLPSGARLLPTTRLFWSGGAASSTLTLGDRASTARYLVATSVTAAGSATADAAYATGALPRVATNTQFGIENVLPIPTTDENELISVVGGAALQAGQRITLVGEYVEAGQ